MERKEREEKGRKEKAKKRNKREITLIYIGGNERERKGDKSYLFKSFQL